MAPCGAGRSSAAVPLVIVVGKGVHVGLRRDGRVVGGVEHSHLRDAGQHAQRLPDAQKRRGIVQRSERGEFLDPLDGVRSQQDRAGEVASAVDHPVSDRLHLGQVGEGAAARSNERCQDRLERPTMIRDPVLFADPADVTPGEDGRGFRVVQLVLDRGTTGVQHQHFHSSDLRCPLLGDHSTHLGVDLGK